MDDDTRRIEKLEEALAFNEHAVERLSEELRLAFERIDTLEKRVASLDERLLRLSESIEDDDRDPRDPEDDLPPHAGRHPTG